VSDRGTPITLDSLRPRRTPIDTLRRVLGLVALLLVLAWAWRDSGMGESWKLWENRGRAVDYVLGQPVDESTREARRLEIARTVRTEFQAEARRQLEAEYDARGEARPSMMALMRQSQDRATGLMASLPPGEFDRRVDQRLEAEGFGGRRGGYFPLETDPRRILGDPDDLPPLHGSVGWIVSMADGIGGPVGSGVRWLFAALAGDGYTAKLLETISIAVWGTLLAVVIAVPTSLLAATSSLQIVTPGDSRLHRATRWIGRFGMRRSFDVARGFNEVVLAMILVAVLGLGPLPGVLALLIHTYGVLGKVFAEAIEAIDPRQVEGVQSTGASASQVLSFAVMPQVLPYVVSQSLLRFESNVRGATVLGVVGAGGIGQLLMDKFGAYEFPEVATMLAIIIVVVTLIDFACGRVVRRVV
jgi:phosphonate transport system permease protein